MKIYRYFRESTKEWENVEGELWRWEAHYNDGKVLHQFDDSDNTFHQFQEIEQDKLFSFKMVSKEKDHTYTLGFNPKHDKLIHFYKNIRNWQTNQLLAKVYCFGRETNVGGTVVKNILMLMPNGDVIATDNPNGVSFD